MDANKYYVGIGDLVSRGNRQGIAMSQAYTKLVYDAEDENLFRRGFEGGTAIQVVDVVVDGQKCRFTLDGNFRIISKFQKITG